MTRRGKILLWLGGAAAVLIAVLGAALAGTYVYLQTDGGRRFLVERIEGAARSETVSLEIGRLEGSPTSSFTIHDIVVSDGSGRFARVSALAVAWRPMNLLRGRLVVDRIAATEVELERLPPAADPGKKETAGPPSLGLGIDIAVNRISVDSLLLGEAVSGESVRLAADGSAVLDADGDAARLQLDVRRLDGTGGRAAFALDYAARPAHFAARAEIGEPPGGQLVRLLGIPGEPALSLRLDGSGPAENWRGRLKATAGEVGATADLSVAIRGGVTAVAAKGEAQAAPLLPAALRPLVGARATFDAAVRSQSDHGWILERLALDGDSLRLDGSGRFSPEKGALAADAVVATRRPIVFPGDAPEFRIGDARIVLHADGSIERPRATLRIAARGLESGDIRIGEGSADLRLAAAEAGDLSLRGTVRLSQLATGTAVPAGLLGETATADIEGTVGPDGGVTVSQLEIRSGALAVSGHGRSLAVGDAHGEYRIALERLGALAEAAGLSPDGAIRLSGRFRGNTASLTGEVGIGGELSGLATQGSALSAVAGPRIPVAATVERRVDGTIGMTGLNIRLAAGSVQGEAAMTPANGALRGQIELIVPELARLSALAGSDLAGRGRLRLDVAGPLAGVSGRADLRLDRVSAAGVAMERVELRADARREGSGGSGTLSVLAVDRGKSVPGSLRFTVDESVARLTDIAIGDNANRVAGALRISLSDALVEGALTGRLTRLSALPIPLAQPPGGMVDLSLRLARADGQRVALTANGRALRVPVADGAAIAIRGASVNATVENALAAPRVRGALRLEQATYGEAALSRLALDVRAAGADAMSFQGSADGRYGTPLALAFAGRIALAGEEIRASVTRLTGAVAGAKIAADRPLELVWRDGADWSGRGALRIAGGSVSGSASRKPAALDARVQVERLPLSLAALAAPDLALDGSLSARATLAGPPAGLRGRLAVELAGVRPRDSDWAEGDSFALSADTTLGPAGLTVAGRLRGPQGTTADLRAETPVRLALAEEGVAISADGPLSGTVTLGGELALFERLIGLGENRLTGRVAGKIGLGGTLRAPQANGRMTLAGGSFESFKAGTVMRDIAATVLFDGSNVRLDALEARDAGDGRVCGEGAIRLDAASGWPLDLRLSFRQFAALARDDASVRASGDLRLRGEAVSPRIEGTFEVDGGEIRIPDQLGGGGAALDVVEVNAPPGAAPAPKTDEAPAAGRAVAIPLDISVAVPGRVFVRGRGVDSEWQGKLRITGTTAKPHVVGNLSVARGSFAFAGRNFDLRDGRVTFQGGDPPDPELAIRAVASIQSLEAAIVVAGTASKPKIELQSNPALPSDEILSRILFGKSFGQLNAIQAAQIAQSAAQLSGGAGGMGVLDRIRRTLGVDVLNVGSQDDTMSGASLQAGKYITEDVFISIDQGTTPGSQKVGVEIELTPNITLESDVGPEAGNSVGVKWKWDY